MLGERVLSLMIPDLIVRREAISVEMANTARQLEALMSQQSLPVTTQIAASTEP
jgi:hypothetical protein